MKKQLKKNTVILTIYILLTSSLLALISFKFALINLLTGLIGVAIIALNESSNRKIFTKNSILKIKDPLIGQMHAMNYILDKGNLGEKQTELLEMALNSNKETQKELDKMMA